MRGAIAIGLAGVLGLATGGCGGSSSSSSAASGPLTTKTTTTATTATRTTPSRRPAGPPARSRTTTSTTSSTTRAAPAPAQPLGRLRSGASYAEYDNCMGSCDGSVPAALERPLHLPSSGCPVSRTSTIAGATVLGSGTVGVAQATAQRFTPFVNSAWNGARVTWFSSAVYRGPILIRGRQIGGPHALGFGLGNVPYDQLQLNDSAGPSPAGTRQWPAFARVRARGCYAYQVDGSSFSQVIVFHAG